MCVIWIYKSMVNLLFLVVFTISFISLRFFTSSCKEFSNLFLFNLNYIFIHQLLIYSTLHGWEFAATSPNVSKSEFIEKVSVNLHDSTLYAGAMSASSENERVSERRHFSLSFSVNSDKSKLFPNFVNQNVDTKLFFNRNTGDLWVFSQRIYFFNRNSINFVVNINAFHILSISFDCINKVVYIIVPMESNMTVVNFILLSNELDHLRINLSQLVGWVEMASSRFLNLNCNFWFLFVKSNSNSV